MNNQIKKVVIVGGGTAGWMVAASLSRYYKKNIDITLVESSEIGTVGVGEATNATIRRFYGALGMSDVEVLKATAGTCKLGIEFKNWYQKDHSFFHPFGLFGQSLNKIPFHHFWLKLHRLGKVSDLSDYSLGIALAKNNKFTLPSENPPSELSIFDWALHFDATLFGRHMRKFAEENGVQRIDAKIVQVEQNKNTGFVERLKLDNGSSVNGELFIDCSGFKGLLIEETLKTGFEDWSDWLVTDRAIAVQSRSVGEPSPYTVSTAHKAGWQWKIPLQHRQGNGNVYSSRFLSDDEASDLLTRNIEGELMHDPRVIQFMPGRRKKAWNKNVVSIGLAAGFLEPLESTAITLVETAIEKLLMLFPDKNFHQGVIDEFNEMTKLEYERVRDFIVLHYHLTKRDDSEMWRYVRNMSIPDTLSQKIKLYKERGHLVKYRWEIFQPASWVALYAGNNVLPSVYDPRVDTYDIDYMEKSLSAMKKSIQSNVADLPSHNEFIKSLAR